MSCISASVYTSQVPQGSLNTGHVVPCLSENTLTFAGRMSAAAAGFGQGMMTGIGRAAGGTGLPILRNMDMRPSGEKLREYMSSLDTDTEKGRSEMLQVVRTMQGDAAAVALQNQFSIQDKERAALKKAEEQQKARVTTYNGVATRLKNAGMEDRVEALLGEVNTTDSSILKDSLRILSQIERDKNKDKNKNKDDEDKVTNRIQKNILNPETNQVEIVSMFEDGTDPIVLGLAPTEPEPSGQTVSVDSGNQVVVTTDADGNVVQAVSYQTDEQKQATIKEQEEKVEAERVELLKKNQLMFASRDNLARQAAVIRTNLESLQSSLVSTLGSPKLEAALQEQNPLIYGTLFQNDEFANIENAVNSIQSVEALGSLQELKAASPTGGSGLGATNTLEIQLLMDETARLDASNPQTLEASLQAIEKHTNNVIAIQNGQTPDIEWTISETLPDGSVQYVVNPVYKDYISQLDDGSLHISLDNGQTWEPVPRPYTVGGITFD